MALISDASPDELESPFYKTNQSICQEFESFIHSHNGIVKGKYNAWSYHAIGKIPSDKKWELQIKKSTYSSGNLVLSSGYQSLQIDSIWTSNLFESDCPDFIISEKQTLKLIFKSFKKLVAHQNYMIKCLNPKHVLIKSLSELLNLQFELIEIYKVTYLKSKLTIHIHSDKLYLNSLLKIIQLD